MLLGPNHPNSGRTRLFCHSCYDSLRVASGPAKRLGPYWGLVLGGQNTSQGRLSRETRLVGSEELGSDLHVAS